MPDAALPRTLAPPSTRTGRMMITVANRLYVAREFAERFEARFRDRAGLVDQMPGFISNQVLRPVNPGDPYVVLTWWESREAFRMWTESDEFRQGHARSGTLPSEAFTGPNKLEIHEVIQDSSRPDLEPEPPGGPMRFH
jgi:heme oxygenase (mycobilin-producing)